MLIYCIILSHDEVFLPDSGFTLWTCPPPLSDCNEEKWCQDLFLNYKALLMADALRTELTDTLKRIELPVSAPAFGSRINTINIRRALLAGFFMQVSCKCFVC